MNKYLLALHSGLHCDGSSEARAEAVGSTCHDTDHAFFPDSIIKVQSFEQAMNHSSRKSIQNTKNPVEHGPYCEYVGHT